MLDFVEVVLGCRSLIEHNKSSEKNYLADQPNNSFHASHVFVRQAIEFSERLGTPLSTISQLRAHNQLYNALVKPTTD